MNELVIHDYLRAKGLNEYGVAGLMGNLFAESGLNPRNLQNSYEKSLSMNDNAYVTAVDNGTYTNFVYDKAGFGLAQWTYWSRKQNLLNFARAAGKSIGDLIMQLDFLWFCEGWEQARGCKIENLCAREYGIPIIHA